MLDVLFFWMKQDKEAEIAQSEDINKKIHINVAIFAIPSA